MVLAQVAIPLAAIVALIFAGWFAGDVLSNPRAGDPDGVFASAWRIARGHLARLLLAAGMAAVLVPPTAVAILWLFHDDAERVASVAGAMAAGVVSALVAVLAAPAIVERATPRATRALDRGTGIAAGMLLWGAAAPATFAALLALGPPAALLAIYTALLDQPVGTAALSVAGFPLGVALVAVVIAAGAGRFAAVAGEHALAAPSTAAAARSLRDGAAVAAMMLTASAVTALGIAAGGTAFPTTGDAEWAALVPAVVALGLIAAVIGFVSLAVWVRLLARPPAAILAGATTAAVLAALMGAAAMPVLLPDGPGWFAAASALGVAGAWSLFVLPSGAGGWRPFVALAVAAGVLGGGALLGASAGVDGIHGSVSGLLGLAVACAAMVALWPFAAMLAWFAGASETAHALRSPPGPLDPEGATGSDVLGGAGAAARMRSETFLLAAGAAVVALAVGAFLAGVRDSLATVAATDPARYVEAGQAMRLLPHGPEYESEAVVMLGRLAGSLEGAGFTGSETGWLIAANDDQARAFARVRAADPGLDADVVAQLGGSPVPLPHVLPLNLARGPGAAGAAIGLLAAVTMSASLLGSSHPLGSDEDSVVAHVAHAGRAGLGAFVLPALAAFAGAAIVGLPARYLVDAAAGWEAAGGFAGAFAAAALVLAAGSRSPATIPAFAAAAVAAVVTAIVLAPVFIL